MAAAALQTPEKLSPPPRVQEEAKKDADLADVLAEKTGALVPFHVMALDDKQQQALKQLLELEEQYTKLEQKYDEEYIQLQAKYDEKYEPLFKQRSAQLAGGKLPSFWLRALQRSEEVGNLIEEHDKPVLEALQDITCEYFSDRNAGWKLTFHFAENDFFSNKVLAKTYHTACVSEWDTSLEYTKVEAEVIQWKPGKDVTMETVKKKAKKSKGKATTEKIARPSFFRQFFRNLGEGFELPSDAEDDEDSDEEEELDDEDKMEALVEEDSELAEFIRDTIVPHAVRFFTHEAGEDDASDAGEEEDEDEDEEEDDDLSDTPPEGPAA